MPTLNKEPEQNVIPEQPKEKKQRIEEASISEIWIQCSGIILSQSDRNICVMENGSMTIM